jgi:hypothetical protein
MIPLPPSIEAGMRFLVVVLLLAWILMFAPMLRFLLEANNWMTLNLTLYSPGKTQLIVSTALIVCCAVVLITYGFKSRSALGILLLKLRKASIRSLELIFEIVIATYIGSVLFLFDFGNYAWNVLAVLNGFALFVLIQELMKGDSP